MKTACNMDLCVYLSFIVMSTGLIKTQTTVKYGHTVGDSCLAQYSAMSHSLSKLVEDMAGIKKKLATYSPDVAAKNESQYQMFYTKKSWIDADLSCSLLGGHLVSFADLAELDAVSDMITQPCSDVRGFWTAGRDIGNNNWIWRDSGHPIKDDLWHASQPNNQALCGHLWTGVSPYRIADLHCEDTLCYICEI